MSAWLAEVGAHSPLVDDLARAVRVGDWPAAHALGECLSVEVAVAELSRYTRVHRKGRFADRPRDFCLYPRPNATAAGSKALQIPRQRYSVRQQRISNMNTSLASMERPDFAKIENRAPSVAQMFLDRVAATPHAEAFRYPQDHSWESVTWQQVGERVHPHRRAG